jgi:hypothetical protein
LNNEVLARWTAELLISSLEDSTWETYDVACRSYSKFCKQNRVHLLTAPSEEVLLGWVTTLHRGTRPLAFASIKKYLGGLKSALDIVGGETQAFKGPRLERCLHAVRKRCPHKSKSQSRLPITIWVLRAFMSHLFSNVFEHNVLAAAMSCAVYGLLRASEFASKRVGVVPLLRSDVYSFADKVVLTLRVSKCDVYREGVKVTLWKNGSSTCPHGALKKIWFSSPAGHPSAPLFQDKREAIP